MAPTSGTEERGGATGQALGASGHARGGLMDTGMEALQRRTLRVLLAAQVFGGGGFFLGFAVSVLLARALTDDEALVGIPIACAVAASALAAEPLGAWMQRAGRRPGLVAGQLCGAVGAVGVVLAAHEGTFAGLCLAMAMFGVGNTANLLARYAASDLAAAERRGRAISAVLLATAAGAILGPNLAHAAGALGGPLGVPEEAAPFAVSAVVLAVAAAILGALLRPDPLLAARGAESGTEAAEGEAAGLEWGPMAVTGVLAMVLANVVMVSVMTMAPIHLDDAGQSLAVVGLVISLHVAGMFLPSPVTGVLVDRVGRLPVIAAAGFVLVAAGGLAMPSTGHDTALVIAAMVLLGIGWNLGLIGGSALLTDSIPLGHRAQAQGRADLAMGLAGALGSLGSGPVMHQGSFAMLALIGSFMGAGLVLLALRAGRLPEAVEAEAVEAEA